jgi:thiol-disulfide isomerase/thioredoxin/uncharacterized membrane protein YcgQ (UPF0703/DUF1980 family)
MNKIIYTIALILIITGCKNVKEDNYYSITGKIEKFKGTIYLKKAIDSGYYFNDVIKDSAVVTDGNFEFKISKKNAIPLPFYIETDKTRTFRFLLEPENQQIIIDSLYYNVSPKIIYKNSTILNEELILKERRAIALNEFKAEFEKIQSPNFPKDSIEKIAFNAREKLNEQSYLTIINFIKDYPNSYVGFWEIAINTSYNGFNEELENAYNNLSVKIKQSEVAKVFENNMTNAKTLKIGRYFPKIKLKNKGLKEVDFTTKENSNPNYTLIDFWFSYCGPCIAQFSKLRKLYTEYNSNQLKIISISTDKTKNIDNWYKVMEQYNIPWLNLLDENGAKTTALGVNSFPTNYLLNKEGIILKKNISLVELEELLKEVE